MATFDNDIVRLNLIQGPLSFPVAFLGFEWPPPERIEKIQLPDGQLLPLAFPLVRTNMSELTDEQRKDNLGRGAEYEYESEMARNLIELVGQIAEVSGIDRRTAALIIAQMVLSKDESDD